MMISFYDVIDFYNLYKLIFQSFKLSYLTMMNMTNDLLYTHMIFHKKIWTVFKQNKKITNTYFTDVSLDSVSIPFFKNQNIPKLLTGCVHYIKVRGNFSYIWCCYQHTISLCKLIESLHNLIFPISMWLLFVWEAANYCVIN